MVKKEREEYKTYDITNQVERAKNNEKKKKKIKKDKANNNKKK